ncbi:translation initiation factor IF-2-like [Panicum virgatum]|uniref:translation initiation factor IF-2-like n=1 Tax=Panicum virgatum TaxID=38727 RepID=UPI0019D51190|nr:translation initiation factor IF-2-like [Panicum virgatum]
MEAFGQLHQQMTTWEADREAKRREHAREIEEINKARAADKEELRREILSMMQTANGQGPPQQPNNNVVASAEVAAAASNMSTPSARKNRKVNTRSLLFPAALGSRRRPSLELPPPALPLSSRRYPSVELPPVAPYLELSPPSTALPSGSGGRGWRPAAAARGERHPSPARAAPLSSACGAALLLMREPRRKRTLRGGPPRPPRQQSFSSSEAVDAGTARPQRLVSHHRLPGTARCPPPSYSRVNSRALPATPPSTELSQTRPRTSPPLPASALGLLAVAPMRAGGGLRAAEGARWWWPLGAHTGGGRGNGNGGEGGRRQQRDPHGSERS